MNFVMIPINTRLDDNDKLLVRRVLISYTRKMPKEVDGVKVIYFAGSKFIAADEYFLDKTKSHQYLFEDDGYTLKSANNEMAEQYLIKPGIFDKRKYHTYEHESVPGGIFFKADTVEEAIKQFNDRVELR